MRLLPALLLLLLHTLFSTSFQFVRNNRNNIQISTSSSQYILKSTNSNDDLMEQMRRTLGDKEDIFSETEKESKQLLQGLRDLDRDPNLKINNLFIEWLSNNGVWVKQQSAWGRAPHPLVIASETEDDGETCGRGLLARESLTEGELMMTIPLDLCLTKFAAQEILGKAIIPDYMDEYIAIAILLLHEKLSKKKDSRWKPYLDILPKETDVYPSYIWSDDELLLLKGSPTYAASKSLKTKIEKEYNELVNTIFKRYSTQFPVEIYTLKEFTWAFVILLSRAARLSSKSNGEELALVPYADLMNHNPYSNTYIDAQKSGMPLISRTEEVAVYSDRSYKKFEQVFINYGEKGNGDLLLLYGFALERNPFNSVDITVGLSKDDPMYNQKKIFLDKSGRGGLSVRFPLQFNRYPSELIDFLRLLLVEPEDLGMQSIDKVDFNEPISPSLERRVLSTMIGICESYLSQYANDVTDDEKLMNDRKMFNTLTRQARMAIKLRASEKRILYNTIKAVNDELLKLPAIVNSNDEIIAAGRSFVRPKTTIANAKGINDWVENRGASNNNNNNGDNNSDEQDKSASIAERRRNRRRGS